MRLTWRLAILFAAGIVLFALCGISGWFAVAGLAYDLVLTALVIADLLLAPEPIKSWEVSRDVEEHISLGVPNRVDVTVRFIAERAAQPRLVLVRDEPPLAFDLKAEPQRMLMFPAGEREVAYAYQVVPAAKGDFQFGNTSIQYAGPLGLIARAHSFKTAAPVKVYPGLHEAEKFEILSRKGLLQQLGIKNVRMRGGGSEFESLREYVPGDEYRKIDWSATARRNKLISRQYEAERSQNVILAIDTGRNMLQPIQKMAKLDYVINTALMLAYVASRSDDKVGLFVFDDETRIFFPPAKSKGQVYRIMNALYNVEARMVESDYADSFADLATRWRRRSLFVLFTDLVDPDSSAGVLNALSIIERRHRAVCVTVSDPNMTGSANLLPENDAEAYQKAVAMQALHERRSAINILKRRGVWTVDSPPENLSVDLINRYMELKSRSAI
jgi:uncharacterized protein (DUF58 family)